MWLFTPHGFFSIVAHRSGRGWLMVRGRVRRDLERLRDAVAGAGAAYTEVGTITVTARADYPYRFNVRTIALERALAAFLRSGLDYDNFKARIARDDRRRARAYHDVWSVLQKHGPALDREVP